MSNIAIKVEHLYKEYKLGVISHGTLYRDMQSWWAKVRGKEDPNSLISSHHGEQTEKDSFLALNDISFEVKEGDRVGIIGRNGAGKSTLLKILSQITSPTKGNIVIRGRVGSLLEVGTGFHSELTGRENIVLNGSILGMNRREISRKLDEIVNFAGIEKHLDTPVKRYSSGMTVRLAFAVAAHLDTDILIADEVLAVGDAEFQKKALGKMQDLSTGEGRTILFVSHNMGAVKSLCNCGIIFEMGKLKASSENITQLVSNYLNNFKSEGQQHIWINNGECITHPYFTPLSLELQEENAQPVIAEISADKKYRIKLVFEVTEVHPLLHFFLCFYANDGNIIFRTNPQDHIKNYSPHIGINTLYCMLPDCLFSDTEYVISIGCGIHNIKVLYDSDLDRIAIKMNVKTRTTLNPYGNYKNIISPKLIWAQE
ncbi:ABC transporter ATP-binding protein [Spirochaetia bacterium]|nr:ABC transporter ATP-binding protein [Spirochaetia bacterium]